VHLRSHRPQRDVVRGEQSGCGKIADRSAVNLTLQTLNRVGTARNVKAKDLLK
jgi:hypothetical protein